MSIQGCESSLEASLSMDNLTLDDNLGLNLCVVPTACHIIVISEDQGLVRREYKKFRFWLVLVDLSQKQKDESDISQFLD